MPSCGRWPPASCPAASRSKSSCLSAEFLIYKLALSAVGARQADSECRRRSCRSTRPRRTCFFTNKLWPGSAPGQSSGEAAARRAQSEHLAQLACCAQRGSTFRHSVARARGRMCVRHVACKSSLRARSEHYRACRSCVRVRLSNFSCAPLEEEGHHCNAYEKGKRSTDLPGRSNVASP